MIGLSFILLGEFHRLADIGLASAVNITGILPCTTGISDASTTSCSGRGSVLSFA